MRLSQLISLAAVAFAVSSSPALAYACEGAGIPTQASCGGDACQCAARCDTNEQCVSGCCDQGYCAVACVCAGEGTTTLDCQESGGCGSVAPTSTPATAHSAFFWGLGLVGMGLALSARSWRRRDGRPALLGVAFALTVLGGAFVVAAAVEAPAPIAAAKSLRQ